MISFLWTVMTLFVSNGDYYSDQYKYSVDPDDFVTFCTGEPPAPIRGFVASTRAVPCDELASEKRLPYFAFWAEYNTVAQASSAKAMADGECDSPVVKSGRGFANSETYECVYKEDGYTEVGMFAQSSENEYIVELRINYRARIRYSGKHDEEIARLARVIFINRQR